jgi:diguanylate cyclase (GGDEF)-like protein
MYRICLLVLLTLLGTSARPEDLLPPARTPFKTYGTEQGLDNLTVATLCQDRQGFLWVGSEGGVFRYDGYRFKGFGKQDGLPSAEIHRIHEDQEGRLWVGTYLGLALWNGSRFVSPGPGLPEGVVEAIRDGADGRIWVTTPKGPYHRLPSGAWQALPGWPGQEASSLWIDRASGQAWVGTTVPRGDALWSVVYRFEQGKWTPIDEPGHFNGEQLDALVQDRLGRLWARSARHLWVLKPGAPRFQPAPAELVLSSNRGQLFLDSKGDVWAPGNGGLIRISGDTHERIGMAQGLPSDWALAVLEDREGNLWVAATGLHRRLGRGLLTTYTAKENLPAEIIWAVARDREHRLWLGTGRGLARATASGWESIPGTESDAVRHFASDARGRFYMGGNTADLLRWDPATRQLTRHRIAVGRPTKRIYRLLVDGEQTLWIGTEAAGLFRASTGSTSLRFEEVKLPGGSPTERIMDLRQDGAGRLWASGSEGLACLERGKWTRYTEAQGLRRTHASYVCPLKNGDLLVSYFESEGASRVRLEAGRLRVVRQFDTTTGLGANKVYSMGEDAHERLWFGTGRGVDLFTPEGAVEHFGMQDGLPSEDCTSMAFLAEPNGDVWIGTSGGVARFTMATYRGMPAPPSSYIVAARLGERAVEPGGTRTLIVPKRDNVLEVNFTGLSYVCDSQVEHQVRLVGFEDRWRATKIQEARYPGLPKGDYRFEVRSRIGQGAWGPVGLFPFQVLPAWYERWGFLGLLGLAAVGAVLAVIRWRIAALRHRTRILEDMVQHRTQELKEAMEALRNQSLTDPLTGLRNRRYLGVCLPEDLAQVTRVHHGILRGQTDRLAVNIDLLFLMVDIDHFKTVNDQHGHAAGDLVLQQVGTILREATRDSDTVIRWGGEEFLVLARNSSRSEGSIVAERIRTRMEAHTFELGDGESLHRTCSIGFAIFPFVSDQPEALPWEQVVNLADQSLYAAKRGGRNAWVGLVAREGIDATALPARLLHDLEGCLASGDIQALSSLPDTGGLEWDVSRSD